MAKKQDLIHFRKWIKELGIRNTANLLDVTYEAVRAWLNDKGTPQNPTARKMLKLSGGKIDPASFFNDRSK